jgi:SAM-dependent methyltransferase
LNYLEAEYANAKKSSFPAALQRFLAEKTGVELREDLPKIVDIGAGTGDFLAAWGGQQYATVGVDREYGIKTGNIASVHQFLLWDFQSRPLFSGGAADIVLCKSVIEHMADPIGFVQLVALFARRDGKVILMAPDFETCSLDFYDDPTHVSPMTLKGLEQTVRMAGFEVEQSGTFTQTPFLLRHPRLASVLRLLTPKRLALLLFRKYGIDGPRRASQAACYVIFGVSPCPPKVTSAA